MITIGKVKALVESNIAAIPNECLEGVTLDENAFTDAVVNVVKKTVTAIKNIVVKIYNGVKNLCVTVGRSVKNFFVQAANRPSKVTNDYMVGKMDTRVITAAKAKAARAQYDETLYMNKWDDMYLESLPNKLEMIDSLQLCVNGTEVPITPRNLIDTVQTGIDSGNFDLDIEKNYDNHVASQYSRIFQVSGTKPNERDIVHRAGGDTKQNIPVSVRLIEDMLRMIETTPALLENIAIKYRRIVGEYTEAEKHLQVLKLSAPTDSARAHRYVTEVSNILNHKNGMYNTVQSAHVKCVTNRCGEYMRTIIDFANIAA